MASADCDCSNSEEIVLDTEEETGGTDAGNLLKVYVYSCHLPTHPFYFLT